VGRPAEIAPAMSIQDMTLPPNIVPSAFVSEGKTISVMMVAEWEGGTPGRTLPGRAFEGDFAM